MSTLQEFLNSNPIDTITDEVVISDRFKDAAGGLLKFKIKAMTSDEFEIARKKSSSISRKGKMEFDVKVFNNTVVVNNTIEPNFKDAESIRTVGCATPEQYLNKVLLAGEIVELAKQIQELSGFDKDIDELVDEAKN